MGKDREDAAAEAAARRVEQRRAAEARQSGALLAVFEHELMALGTVSPHHVAHELVSATVAHLAASASSRGPGTTSTRLARAEANVALALEVQHTSPRRCSWPDRCNLGCSCTYCAEARTLA